MSSFRKPLSTSLKPNLGPISPTTIPKREGEKERASECVSKNDSDRKKAHRDRKVNKGLTLP